MYRNGWLDIDAANELLNLLVSMVLYVFDASLCLSQLSHGNTYAIRQPLVRIIQNKL